MVKRANGPGVVSERTSRRRSELRVGIAGAGYIAQAHAAAYAATPGVRLVAVTDPVAPKASRLADRVGARTVPSVAELLDTGVDAISVCTPTPTHCAIVTEALAVGLHVLCEKPVALTMADADLIVAASETSVGKLMVGHVSRFEPDHRRAQQVVAAGRLGELHLSSQSITGTAPSWSEGAWLADVGQSGGPIVDLAIHSFDYLAWLHQSDPVRVTAMAADTAAGPASYALVTLRFANGAIGTVETSWAHPRAHGLRVATELAGSGGRLDWTYDGVTVGSMIAADGTTTTFEPLGDRGFRAEIAAFVDAIRRDTPSPVSATEGRAALRTALGALESVRLGRPVDLAVGSAR